MDLDTEIHTIVGGNIIARSYGQGESFKNGKYRDRELWCETTNSQASIEHNLIASGYRLGAIWSNSWWGKYFKDGQYLQFYLVTKPRWFFFKKVFVHIGAKC